MRIFYMLAVSAAVTASLLFSNNFFKKSSSQELEKISHQFQSIVDTYFDAYLKLNPLFASSIGDHRYDDQLTIPISKEMREKQRDLFQTFLKKMKKIRYQDLIGQDKLTYQMFLEDLQNSAALLKVDLDYLMPFNQVNSFFSDFAVLASGSSYVTFNTALDYENFLKRCKIVPAYIDTMIANMKEGIQRNITTPEVLVEEGLAQLNALLLPDYQASVFYRPLLTIDSKMSPNKSREIKAQYAQIIQQEIYPAYHKLKNFIEKTYLPHARKSYGLCEIPGGRDFYLALIKNYTTTSLTPEQIQEIGKREVKRILEELEEIKKQQGFEGDLSAFFASLNEKTPQLYPFHTAEQVINAYWAIYSKIIEKMPLYFSHMPQVTFTIKQEEPFKQENSSESYENPSEDGTRPGIFWVPIPAPQDYPVKNMESIFLHEVIPGHHFQISIQQLLDLPRYRKFMGNTSYIEGWALYAESLGKDLGMYKNYYQWIGRLSMEMHRAIRLVVDTGIHWYGWSREEAIEYSFQHEPEDRKSILSEIDRYIGIPGQAVTYKVGELKIQELKKKAQVLLQAAYTDADFHDLILKNGALPLSVLDAEVNRFIQKSL